MLLLGFFSSALALPLSKSVEVQDLNSRDKSAGSFIGKIAETDAASSKWRIYSKSVKVGLTECETDTILVVNNTHTSTIAASGVALCFGPDYSDIRINQSGLLIPGYVNSPMQIKIDATYLVTFSYGSQQYQFSFARTTQDTLVVSAVTAEEQP